MSACEVVIKHEAPLKVASVRDIIPSFPKQGSLWDEIEPFLISHNITPNGPSLTIY